MKIHEIPEILKYTKRDLLIVSDIMKHCNTLSYSEEIVFIEQLKEDEKFKTLVLQNYMKEQLVSSIAKNGLT